MAIIDPETQVRGRSHWYLLGAGAAIVALILFLVFGNQPSLSTKLTEKSETDNPLAAARHTLGELRETDLESCRSALAKVNAYLAKPGKRQPEPLTETESAALRERLDLDGGEVAEIGRGSFTPLDNHYLDLCFLLRDAAAALVVEQSSGEKDERRPLRQAEAAFGWAVRQVCLEKADAPPLPPQFTLRRGKGTPLDRALVFLELLRHVASADDPLIGCLVFCPGRDGAMQFWACGVLVTDKPDLFLFDPRLGLPIPGPKGVGIATLKAAQTDPTVLGQLTSDDKHRYDVTHEHAAKAELRYVCSLSALAPRMRFLQTELAPKVKVQLYVPAADEMQRLTETLKLPVQAWQVGKASGAGVLRRFLPPVEGGVDESKPYSRSEQFVRGIIPWKALPSDFLNENRFPPRVGLGLHVRMTFSDPFLRAVRQPHGTRDELLRGHYEKAMAMKEGGLIETRSECQILQESLIEAEKDPILDRKITEWLDQAIPVYADQLRAAGNPQQLNDANQRIVELWKKADVVNVRLYGARAWPLRLEVGYQLGLCKHEQAERLQFQWELNEKDEELKRRAMDAWKEAVNVWQQYLDAYREARYFERDYANAAAASVGTAPGAAARMLGRAQFMAGERDAARRTWQDPEPPTVELERVGSLYLAKKTEK